MRACGFNNLQESPEPSSSPEPRPSENPFLNWVLVAHT
jgi:hypothetical protein